MAYAIITIPWRSTNDRCLPLVWLHDGCTHVPRVRSNLTEQELHLRTGDVIESPFVMLRLRQRVTKGADSRQKGLLMAFKLLAMAERRWRISAPAAGASGPGQGGVSRRRGG